MKLCALRWSICEVSASHLRWWNPFILALATPQTWGCQSRILRSYMQQALVTALFSTVTKYVCLRAGCRLGGSCPIPWSPAGSCLPRCSPGRVGIGLFLPAPENWSGRAAVPRWVSSSTAFVKPHPPQLGARLLIRTAHYYYNELLASCVKFCQKLLTFFVSVLRKQIVTRAWLHSAIPRKAEQQGLGTGGRDAVASSGCPGR